MKLPETLAKLLDNAAYDYMKRGHAGAVNAADVFGDGADWMAEQLLPAIESAREALRSTLDDMNHYYENKCCPSQEEVDQLKQALASLDAAFDWSE